jgi:hypothetical protein
MCKEQWMMIAAAVGSAIMAVSCAPVTPEQRILHNQEAFNALPPRQQEDVRAGRLSRGMDEQAVLLAWGRPSRRVEIVGEQGATERWDYAASRPVHVSTAHVGYGWDRYGRHPGSGFGYGPDVVYLPYRRAAVWFVDGRVDAWESLR